jgi:hypothetical protein
MEVISYALGEHFCIHPAVRHSRVEEGYNTSTAALRVVESDEKEPGSWGYN